MTESSDPHPEIFELLLSTLRGLASEGDPRSAVRYLEAHLLKVSGLLPEIGSMGLSPGARLSLQQILRQEGGDEGIRRLRLARAVEEELRGVFQRLVNGALDRELKSQLFLQSVGLC
jgi:hypothetical protein